MLSPSEIESLSIAPTPFLTDNSQLPELDVVSANLIGRYESQHESFKGLELPTLAAVKPKEGADKVRNRA